MKVWILYGRWHMKTTRVYRRKSAAVAAKKRKLWPRDWVIVQRTVR